MVQARRARIDVWKVAVRLGGLSTYNDEQAGPSLTQESSVSNVGLGAGAEFQGLSEYCRYPLEKHQIRIADL